MPRPERRPEPDLGVGDCPDCGRRTIAVRHPDGRVELADGLYPRGRQMCWVPHRCGPPADLRGRMARNLEN